MSADSRTDRDICCVDCPIVDSLWRPMQLARSILEHRDPSAETVTLALRALDGDSIEALCGGSPAVPGSREE